MFFAKIQYLGLASSFSFGSSHKLALDLQAAQQLGGGFAFRVLQHPLTAKRLGQQRGGLVRGGGLRLGKAGFEPVGKDKQGFYAADNFGLCPQRGAI